MSNKLGKMLEMVDYGKVKLVDSSKTSNIADNMKAKDENSEILYYIVIKRCGVNI